MSCYQGNNFNLENINLNFYFIIIKKKKNITFLLSALTFWHKKKYMRMLWCLTPTLSIISFVWPNQVERKHDGDWKDFLAICASLPAPQQIKDWNWEVKTGEKYLDLKQVFFSRTRRTQIVLSVYCIITYLVSVFGFVLFCFSALVVWPMTSKQILTQKFSIMFSILPISLCI